MRILLMAAALALAACTTEPQLAPDTPPIILTGEITRADHQTYKEIPFTVPAGTGRITIDFTYNKTNRTVIDLGLRDPNGQRGWSGGNKSHIEIGEHDSTPSYTRGVIQPGEWRLVLGIPNIRESQTAHYEATITLAPSSGEKQRPRLVPLTGPLSATPGWRRGDFHAHTAHSDGSCDVAGTRGPCPSLNTFEAARDANLDFIAITDHNTITQLPDIRARQADFPKTLLIPGTEITTFNGHANAIGNADFLDFQLGSPHLPTLAKLFDQVDAAGGFLSINHPGLPSGEVCMGCGWTVKDTDWSRVTALELINGSTLRTADADSLLQGGALWMKLLNEGRRITAIGGSDNHDATDRTGARQAPIGKPTTVVYASELSTKGIVAGVKSGRVFIDVTGGLPGATLDMEGVAVNQAAAMGGELVLSRDGVATITARADGLPEGATIIMISHGLDTTYVSHTTHDHTLTARLAADHTFGWVYAEVSDSNNATLLIGNPIYIRASGNAP